MTNQVKLIGCNVELETDYESYGKATGEHDVVCNIVATFDTADLAKKYTKGSVTDGEYDVDSMLEHYEGHKIESCGDECELLEVPHNPT